MDAEDRQPRDPSPPNGASSDVWLAGVAAALDGSGLRVAVQPIVDLALGTTVGYEALSRFTGPPDAPPNVWFAKAAELGLGAPLDAMAMHLALSLRRSLPPNAFLSVNVDPTHLTDPDMTEVFRRAGNLSGLVVELTEHSEIDDYDAVSRRLQILRDKGARVAVDDAGSSQKGLQWLSVVAPDLVRLDRSLVADVATDESKRALVEMLGIFAAGFDAQIVAEGIERQEELDALVTLGVPLGQGYLLGRPSLVDWPTVDPHIATRVRSRVEQTRLQASAASG